MVWRSLGKHIHIGSGHPAKGPQPCPSPVVAWGTAGPFGRDFAAVAGQKAARSRTILVFCQSFPSTTAKSSHRLNDSPAKDRRDALLPRHRCDRRPSRASLTLALGLSALAETGHAGEAGGRSQPRKNPQPNRRRRRRRRSRRPRTSPRQKRRRPKSRPTRKRQRATPRLPNRSRSRTMWRRRRPSPAAAPLSPPVAAPAPPARQKSHRADTGAQARHAGRDRRDLEHLEGGSRPARGSDRARPQAQA